MKKLILIIALLFTGSVFAEPGKDQGKVQEKVPGNEVNAKLRNAVQFTVKDLGPYQIVYTRHTGSYDEVLGSIMVVAKWAEQNRLDCQMSFGEYLNDPAFVAKDQLQSNVGCVTGVQPRKLPQEFSYREIPRGLYLTVNFEGSPKLGAKIVYPQAMEWLAQNHYELRGPVFEIYTLFGTRIHTKYLLPIVQK